MRKYVAGIIASLMFVSTSAEAHFHLDAPPAAVVQNGTGDPQKPGSATDACPNGTASGAVTQVHVGDAVKVKITETIGHGGHYRVSFASAESAFQFPATTVTSNQCISTTIAETPALPVLADGLFVHDQNQANAGKICNDTDTCETNVTVPNVAPGTYILQVIQWMTPHGSGPNNAAYGCFYTHCANIEVLESESEIPDGGVVFQDAGSSTSGGGSSNGERDGGTSGPSGTRLQSSPSDASCSVSHEGGAASLCVPLFLGFGVVGMLRRRKPRT